MDLIKKNLGSTRLIIGTEQTIKQLQNGKVATVFISSNCPASVREDLLRYAKMADAEVLELEQSNEELGAVCRKPFLISVLCLKKDG